MLVDGLTQLVRPLNMLLRAFSVTQDPPSLWSYETISRRGVLCAKATIPYIPVLYLVHFDMFGYDDKILIIVEPSPSSLVTTSAKAGKYCKLLRCVRMWRIFMVEM